MSKCPEISYINDISEGVGKHRRPQPNVVSLSTDDGRQQLQTPYEKMNVMNVIRNRQISTNK